MQGFQKVISTADFTISMQHGSNKCNLRISDNQSPSICYETTVTKLSEKIKLFCENGLADLKNILSNEQNFVIEKGERKRILRVLLPNPITHAKSEYDKFILQQKLETESNIQQIVNLCSMEKDLSQSQIKEFFEVLALEVDDLKLNLRKSLLRKESAVEKPSEELKKVVQNLFEQRAAYFQKVKGQIEKIYSQLKDGVVEQKIVKVAERVSQIEKRMENERLYQKTLSNTEEIKKLKAKVEGIINKAFPNPAEGLTLTEKYSEYSKSCLDDIQFYENDPYLNSSIEGKQKIASLKKKQFKNQNFGINNSMKPLKADQSQLLNAQPKVKTEIQQIQKSKSWIDTNSFGFKSVTVKENKIFAKNWVDVFGSPRISEKPQFKVNIIKMGKYMVIGIVDEQLKYKIKQSKSKNQIYYNSGSIVWNGEQKLQKQGPGFKQGDLITVNVDIEEGLIRWAKNQKIIYELQSDKIKDLSIGWVPFVYLSNIGDIIQAY